MIPTKQISRKVRWEVAGDLSIDANDAFLEGRKKDANAMFRAADKLRVGDSLTGIEYMFAEPYLVMRTNKKLASKFKGK